MMNYSKDRQENQVKNTWLHLSFKDDVTDSFGNEIPYPHYHYISKNNRTTYCWLLDGFFDTKKNTEYLNDIIARFKITFIDSKYVKHSKDSESSITPLKLKQFQGLKSKAKAILKEKYERAETHQDYVWWCIKLYCEDLIRQDGLIVYSTLESWAFENFIDHTKDNSTLRAKCRSTYNWYFDRDWKIGRAKRSNKTKEEIMATRQEHAKKIHTKLAEETKRKVLNLTTGMFKDDYKKPNGSWNISKIAKESGTSRPTVMKYLPKDSLF